MIDIQFESDDIPVPRKKQQQSSRVTQFFIDFSFGYIKTPKEAVKAQLVVGILLLILSGYFFSKSDAIKVPTTPSQELINTPQPTQPFN